MKTKKLNNSEASHVYMFGHNAGISQKKWDVIFHTVRCSACGRSLKRYKSTDICIVCAKGLGLCDDE